MSNEGKKTYYQNVIPHQETIQAHFQGTQVPHHEFVDKTIIEGIIGEIYFHPEDKEQVKEGVPSIFQENKDQCYRFIIQNPLQLVWLHQIDLKLQLFYKELLVVEDDVAPENERDFNSISTGPIAFLQQ